MHFRSLTAFLALFVSFCAPLDSQTTASSSGDVAAPLKAKARLVLVDVVVTNEKSDPVAGLGKKDFEILEDGKPQTIANFEEHHGVPPTQIKLPPLPPGVYTNFPLVPSADSVNILLSTP